MQSMEFSRPEYWNGLPFPSPGDLPNPGIEPRSPALQGDSLPAEPPGKPSFFCGCPKKVRAGGAGFELCRHFIQLLALKSHVGLSTKYDLLQQMR